MRISFVLAGSLLLTALGCGKTGVSVEVSAVAPTVAVNDASGDEATAKKEDVTTPLAPGGSFQFPDDEGGRLLANILPPARPAPFAGPTPKPQSARLLPPSISDPSLPPSLSPAIPVRIPVPPRIDSRPMPLPDRVPIDFALMKLELPERIELPVGGLTRIAARDVKQPTLLPILATPSPDRASLDDPTTEFTAQSIINDKLPLRTAPAPFVKTNLPDPFENAEAVRVKVASKEDPRTALGNPPPPKP